jgi:hypothetical protein
MLVQYHATVSVIMNTGHDRTIKLLVLFLA